LPFLIYTVAENIAGGLTGRRSYSAGQVQRKAAAIPVRFQVAGPDATRVFEKTIQVEIPMRDIKPEPPFVREVFSEDVRIDGPSGKYRFLATFEHGAAAGGGNVEFYVGDAAEMPPVKHEVVLCSHDPELADWCAARGIRINNSFAPEQRERELILVSGISPTDRAAGFTDLARRMRGARRSFS
jgi:hypothetical protein